MRASRVLIGGAAIVALAIVVGLLLVIRPFGGGQSHLTVDFDRTVSLYEGADVRILGVPVGQVDSVEPMGEKVRVELSWDSEYKVPDDVQAVIVSPAIVGDRYVQLTPAYSSGPELEDDAVLDASRTRVPVELDQVYDSLDQLATALGPKGANKNGALNRILSSSAKTFDGQGEKFHQMLEDLSKFTGTLDDNKDELFASMTQLERFTKALADNDTVVRRFNSSLSEVSGVLKGEQDDLAGALRALGSSLEEVRSYVRENRSAVKGNVDALVDVTNQLVDQRQNLSKILDTAPTAVSNQVLAYDPSMGALSNRTSIIPAGATLNAFGLEWGLVSPKYLNGWAGAQQAFCALFGPRGSQSPQARACLRAFPQDFFAFVATRGLSPTWQRPSTPGVPPSVATPKNDELDKLRRTSDAAGLGRLLAVQQ